MDSALLSQNVEDIYINLVLLISLLTMMLKSNLNTDIKHLFTMLIKRPFHVSILKLIKKDFIHFSRIIYLIRMVINEALLHL